MTRGVGVSARAAKETLPHLAVIINERVISFL